MRRLDPKPGLFDFYDGGSDICGLQPPHHVFYDGEFDALTTSDSTVARVATCSGKCKAFSHFFSCIGKKIEFKPNFGLLQPQQTTTNCHIAF